MPAVADEGGYRDLKSERGRMNVTQQFLSADDFFQTSNPRAVKLAEMNFISINCERILMSSYMNEAVFCPFLCLNWTPTGMCVAGVQIDKTHGTGCLALSEPFWTSPSLFYCPPPQSSYILEE